MNMTLDNNTETADTLDLADLTMPAPARYAHLSLLDSTHVTTLAPAVPARRKARVDWYAGGVILLMLSALATAIDLLTHLN